jgi:hypothetical protein
VRSSWRAHVDYRIVEAVRRAPDDEDTMRLPGTRYQEHGWEQVRKLLGQCSLQAFAHGELEALLAPGAEQVLLGHYVDAVAASLRACARSARAEAPGNSYGDSVAELALTLVLELQARPLDWSGFAAAVIAEHSRSGPFWAKAGGDAILRKKINDMFAVLRDKVDSDNYQAACGRSCSPNKIYTYRMLDTAYSDIARIFASWQEHAAQVAAILGRPCDGSPIEVRQMSTIARCRGEWIIRWSASLEQFGSGPGPLHTRSKRFASLKNSPEKIDLMLAEIGDYEELSSNRDNDWQFDASEAADWMDDYLRVMGDSEQAQADGQALEDQLLPAPEEEPIETPAQAEDVAVAEHDSPAEIAIATALSLPPRYLQMARAAQERGSWAVRALDGFSLPVRLAVYLKMLGSDDDSYPDEWRDPATGELPNMQQLATLDQLSLPTLRKRRDEAIAALLATPAH